MSLTVAELQAVLTLDTKGFDTASTAAQKTLKDLEKAAATTKINADNTDALKKANETSKKLDEVGKAKPTPKVSADAGSARKVLGEISQELSALDKTVATPKVEVDTGGAESKMSRFAKTATDNADAWGKVGGVLMTAGGAVTAMGAAALKTGIDYNTLQQSSRAALTTMLGGLEQANAQMDALDDFARTSPFAKQVFIQAQQQMLAFGIEAHKVIPYLDAIQEAMAAAGKGNVEIAGVAEILSKISSSAKITAEDLNQLGNYGVDAAQVIGDKMGVTAGEIRAQISAGALDAKTALDLLTEGMKENFDGAADGLKNTFTGAMDRVKGAWRDLSSELAEPLVGKEGGGFLVDAANGAADMMRTFQRANPVVKATTVGVIGLAGAAALMSGTFLVAAPRIVATKAAMATLATQMPRTAMAMKGLGKAAGVAVGAMMAIAALDAIGGKIGSKGEVAEVDAMTNALNEFAIAGTNTAGDFEASALRTRVALDDIFNVSSTSGFTGGAFGNDQGFVSLEHALERLKDEGSGVKNVLWGLADAVGAAEHPANLANEAISNFDTTLAQMVQSGNTDAATAAAEEFKVAALEAGHSAEDVENMLEGYNNAVKAVAVAEEQAAAATKSAAQSRAADYGYIGEMSEEAAKSLDKWREATATAHASFIDAGRGYDTVVEKNKELAQATADATGSSKDSWEDYYDGVSVSMGDLIKEMEDQVAAQDAWEENLAGLGERINQKLPPDLRKTGREMLEALTAEGADGAALVETLSQSSKKELRKYTELWGEGGTDAGIKFTDELETAANPMLDIDADVTKAEQARDQFIRSTSGQTIRMRLDASGIQTTITTGPRNAIAKATGGIVNFADGSENHVAQIARAGDWRVWAEPETGGEAYIPLAQSKRPRSREILRQVAQQFGMEVYKDGGLTGGAGAGLAPLSTLKKHEPFVASKKEVLQKEQRIADLKKDLAAKEKDGKRKGQYTLTGRQRKITELELKEARADLSMSREANRLNRMPAGTIKAQIKAHEKAAAKQERQAERRQERDEQRAADAVEANRAAAERDERMRDLTQGVETSVRRGNYVDSITGGLSGALSVVDEMYGLSQNEDLSPQARQRLAAQAAQAEGVLTSLYGRLDQVKAELTEAQGRLDAAKAIQDSAMTAGRADFVSTLTDKRSTPASVLKKLNDDIAAWQQFGPNLKILAGKGMPKTFLRELVNKGLDGATAASKLLNAPNLDEIINSAHGLDSATAAFGDTAASLFDAEGLGVNALEGVVAGLESSKATLEKAIEDIAATMVGAFKKELGIASPSKVFFKLTNKDIADGAVNGLIAARPRVSAAAATMLEVPQSALTVTAPHGLQTGTAVGTQVNLTVNYPVGEPTVLTVEKSLQEILAGGGI
ncbi:tape measure domain-containing protein [Micrococcales bacterium KH10]|nr:tape measure domain-containing protein [Micrococcales bacterium KH10]